MAMVLESGGGWGVVEVNLSGREVEMGHGLQAEGSLWSNAYSL